MKETTNSHVFQHPWETVVTAVWRKYPNPMTTSVVGTDIIDRKIDKNGVLKSHRLMLTEWFIPKWARPILGQDQQAYGSEHSECDPKKKVLTLRTRNITFSSLVVIDETLTYSPSQGRNKGTCLNQYTKVTVNDMIPFAGAIETYLIDNIATNTHKGRDAMEWTIDNIKKEAEEAMRNMDEVFTNIQVQPGMNTL